MAQDVPDSPPHENVALEDVVVVLVKCATGESVPLELSQPEQMGRIDVVVSE